MKEQPMSDGIATNRCNKCGQEYLGKVCGCDDVENTDD